MQFSPARDAPIMMTPSRILTYGVAAVFLLGAKLAASRETKDDAAQGRSETMRAYVATSPNCAEQSYTVDMAVPKLGDLRETYSNLPAGACEVIIKVEASSINPSDIHPTVAAEAGIPHVMGSDVAGRVLSVESACANRSRVRVGDLVWGDIGANTLTKLQNDKTKELGGYGELALALDTQLGKIPANLGFAEAASLPKVALTSWKALTWYAGGLNATFQGRKVLILGGSGGTGSTGIQIARALGAGEIITTTSAGNSQYVKELGANRTIDYHEYDWWDPSVIAPDSVDVVYDCVGQSGTGDRAMSVLKVGGFYVTITGALADHVKKGVQQHMFINSDTNLNSGKLLDALKDLAERDMLRMPRIEHMYMLDEIPQAFEQSKTGHVVGKLVVNVTKTADVRSAPVLPSYNSDPSGEYYDLVVYGSSPAGVAAAVAASRLGLSVALFEPLQMIGGMGAAGNLGLNDGGNKAEHTGLALEFAKRAAEHYGLPDKSVVAHPESFVAEAVFNEMLLKAGVNHIYLGCRLVGATTTTATLENASKIRDVTVTCKKSPVRAKSFIDASYDGELMVAAKDIEYTWGRESRSTYGESLAGARYPGFVGVGGPQHVSALHDDGSLLKYVQNMTEELPPPGEADDALMAFQHRLCLTDNPDNKVDWYKPKDYNPDDFLLLQRTLEAAGNNSDFFTSLPPAGLSSFGVPKEKRKYCLCCGISVYSTDQPGLNKGWANASWERKQEIIADHVYFELGSFYYLANDPKVPASVRSKFSQYGLCKDEFAKFGHIPPQLYIRISNRMVGDYVLTQNNLASPQLKGDSIAVGDWSFDEHMTGKYAVYMGAGKWEVQLEGNFWPAVTPNPGNASDKRPQSNWYDVPFRAIVPKRGTGSNLLVPVALSASAVAFSSTRIENMYMSVGTAAGVAAAQYISDPTLHQIQDVNVTKIQLILRSLFRQRVHGPPYSPYSN